MNKNEKLQEAMGMIGEDLIADARDEAAINMGRLERRLNKRKKYSRVLIGMSTAAMFAAVITSIAIKINTGEGKTPIHQKETQSIGHLAEEITTGSSGGQGDDNGEKNDDKVNTGVIDTKEDNEILNAYVLAKPEYPVMSPYPDEQKAIQNNSYELFQKEYAAWSQDRAAQKEMYSSMHIDISDFVGESAKEFLGNSTDNVVYSPLNIYMALGMLAELTDGNSREQILDLLGTDNIDSLRKEANAIWNANYYNDGAVTSVLASSVWLNRDINFKQETMNRLASNYYASSYQGEMGSEAFDLALQEWLTEKTGGLLKEQTGNLHMDARTVLSLATTVYYSANWHNKFSKDKTDIQTFHGTNDETEVEFMNKEISMNYYWGDKFSAIKNSLEASGDMYFILPDEGVSIDELLEDKQWLELVEAGDKWSNSKMLTVKMSIPKFDASSNLELSEGLKNLGVTDVFDSITADFTQMTDDTMVELSKVEHGARVVIDEDGCIAASFTAIMAAGGAMPPDDKVDFVLDRPFIFAVTSEIGTPMFIGVVNNVW